MVSDSYSDACSETDAPSTRVQRTRPLITISDAMLDVKEATQVALSYFEDLYDENAFSNVLLEEVERDEEDGTPYWLITIGFTDENAKRKERSGLAAISPAAPPRRYKRFKIDAETGDVVSMKIRSVENA